MAKLKDRLKLSLDESRMLILGAQVVLGFEFRSAFEDTFRELPSKLQLAHLGATGLVMLAVVLLMYPGAYHRLVARGETEERVVRTVYGVMDPVLAIFSMALGI